MEDSLCKYTFFPININIYPKYEFNQLTNFIYMNNCFYHLKEDSLTNNNDILLVD